LSGVVCVKRRGRLLIICYFTATPPELWSFIFSLFGVEWVMPQTMLDLLTTWGASFGHGLAKKAWRLVPHCVLWSIWRERNARLFEDVETVMIVLRKRVLNTLFLLLASSLCYLGVFTFVDFLNLLPIPPF
jgi:hypothetical protein